MAALRPASGSHIIRLTVIATLVTLTSACGGGTTSTPEHSPSHAYNNPQTLDEAIVIAVDIVSRAETAVASDYPLKADRRDKQDFTSCAGAGYDPSKGRSWQEIVLRVPEDERRQLGDDVAEHWRARGFNLIGADGWHSPDEQDEEQDFAANVVPNVRAYFEIKRAGTVEIAASTECLPNPDHDPDAIPPSEEASPPIGGR